jgi:hypothetical protein
MTDFASAERVGKNSRFAFGGLFHVAVFDWPLMQTSINVPTRLPCDTRQVSAKLPAE